MYRTPFCLAHLYNATLKQTRHLYTRESGTLSAVCGTDQIVVVSSAQRLSMRERVVYFAAIAAIVYTHLQRFAHGKSLEISFDNAVSWTPYTEPRPTATFVTSDSVKLRTAGTQSYISLPACVARAKLKAVAHEAGLGILESSCNEVTNNDEGHASVHLLKDASLETARARAPVWHLFLHDGSNSKAEGSGSKQLENEQDGEGETEQVSYGWGATFKAAVFSWYGIGVMLFFSYALFQGIRQGIEEVRLEEERERQRELGKTERSKSGKRNTTNAQPGSTKIVVPTARRKTSKEKKRKTASASVPNTAANATAGASSRTR